MCSQASLVQIDDDLCFYGGGQCDILHIICDDWIRIMTSRFVVVIRVGELA